MSTRCKVGTLVWLLALVIIAGGFLTGLAGAIAGESASPAGDPAPYLSSDKIVLKIGWMVGPDNLNPFIGYEGSSYEIWSLQYDALFAQYPDGSRGAELAAERPTIDNGGISADGTVWTVKIRSGVKWQDGKPLTAEDVAFTYNYIIQGNLWNFTFLTAGIEKVEALDPTTVRIVCSKPKADMLTSTPPILPKHVWEDVKPGTAQTSYANTPPIIGSGPFQVVEFKKGNYVKMVRNPDYWGERPAIDEIYFQTYTNADTMVQELRSGAIDAAEDIPRAQFQILANDSTLQTCAYNVVTWSYLTFNSYEGRSKGAPVLRDREFRRALCRAIDRRTLVDVAWGGLADEGTTIINPDTWSSPDYHWEPPAEKKLAFDLEEAKQALEAAGYRDSNGDGVREDATGRPVKVRLWANADSEPHVSEAKLIAGWWKEVGIDVELEVLDQGTMDDHYWNYEGSTYVPDYDAYIDSATGYSDPGQTLPWYTTEQIGNWNEPCWSNAEFDRLAVEQTTMRDPARRAEMFWRMQELMYDDAVYPVLTYPKSLQAYDVEEWKGWKPLGFGAGDAPGPALFSSYNAECYLDLEPTTTGNGDESAHSTTTVVSLIVVGVIIAGLAVWFLLRRRTPRSETVDEA